MLGHRVQLIDLKTPGWSKQFGRVVGQHSKKHESYLVLMDDGREVVEFVCLELSTGRELIACRRPFSFDSSSNAGICEASKFDDGGGSRGRAGRFRHLGSGLCVSPYGDVDECMLTPHTLPRRPTGRRGQLKPTQSGGGQTPHALGAHATPT